MEIKHTNPVKLDWKTLGQCFAIGLAAHCLWALLLVHTATLDIYKDYCLRSSDAITYIIPADVYMKTGDIPGYWRTVAYPFLIAVLKGRSPEHWTAIMVWLQVITSALVYPALAVLPQLFRMERARRIGLMTTWFLVILGTYYAHLPFCILTDSFFATSFTLFVALACYGVIENKWLPTILSIGFFAFAALLRPTLNYFTPVALVALIWLLTAIYKISIPRAISLRSGMLIFILLSTTLFSQLPSIRNKIKYGAYLPTSLQAELMYQYYARCIDAEATGRDAESLYAAYQEREISQPNRSLQKDNDFCMAEAKKTIKRYPREAVVVFMTNFFRNLITPDWLVIGSYWEQDWTTRDAAGVRMQKATWCLIVVCCAALIWIGFLFLAGYQGILALLNRQIFALVAVGLFLFYFLLPLGFEPGGSRRLRMPITGFILLLGTLSAEQLINRRMTHKGEPLMDTIPVSEAHVQS